MNKIKLVKPSLNFKTQLFEYKKEFEDNNDNNDNMSGSGNLEDYNSIEKWLDTKNNNIKETVKEGLVPSSTFLALSRETNTIIGMIDIRHSLNDYLLKFGGHIGYSVRKSERLKGYATEILHCGLEECKSMNIDKVLVTCDKDNIGSSKTIIRNSGILENEVLENGIIKQRYWITLTN